MVNSETSRCTQKCQKIKHGSIFIVYNGVHYHISSAVIFQNGKVNKPR